MHNAHHTHLHVPRDIGVAITVPVEVILPRLIVGRQDASMHKLEETHMNTSMACASRCACTVYHAMRNM